VKHISRSLFILALWLCTPLAGAVDICLPTANDALLRTGHDAEFFQPTVEGSTESGMFGYVRSHGARFHEGIDIKCLQRDKHGEPTDPVHAVADGEVAFINSKPGLSNYGRYVIIEHHWDGVQVFTLYAHLREVADGLVAGQPVKKGQVIGTLGHSSNTREGISRDRAHLHFEVDVMLNPNFRIWYPKHDPKAPPFGNFNGRNLYGLDPAAFLRAYAADRKLNFAEYLAKQPFTFTILIKARPFPYLKLHPEQLHPGTTPDAGTAPFAYEISATVWGLPIAIWPRTAAELTEAQRRSLERGLPVLRQVNSTELGNVTRRGLLLRGKSGWQLSNTGYEWADLLVYGS
jgi:peptidoglycan LD-endopeptidase LytH